ncbi:MAG: pilin [Patescibacteria group bacterium]
MARQKNILLFGALLAVMACSLILASLPLQAAAQEGEEAAADECAFDCNGDSDSYVRLNIVIPGVAPMTPCGFPAVKNMQCFIRGMYIYFAWTAGILATAMIMFGGFKYVVSFGSPTKVADAKDTIISAMIGLALLLASYTILYFINPNIVNLKDLDLQSIGALKEGVIWCEDIAPGGAQEQLLDPQLDPMDANNRPRPIDLGETWDTSQLKCGVEGLMVYTDGHEQPCVYQGAYSGAGCPDQNGSQTVCAPDYLTGEGFKCVEPERYCTFAFAGTCERVDEVFQTQPQFGAGLCEASRDGSGCIYRDSDVLSCEEAQHENYYQVYCDTGNNLQRGTGQNTDCWGIGDPTEPEYRNEPDESSVWNGHTRKCVDRRTGGYDWAICCLELSNTSGGIECRNECNSDEIMVANCILPEHIETPVIEDQGLLDAWVRTIRNAETGRIITGCTDAQLSQNMVCCMEMEFEYVTKQDPEQPR